MLYQPLLRQSYVADALYLKIEERLKLHHGDVQWALPSCQAMKESLMAARGTAANIAVKTWTGSWTTSSRMHEPFLLPCLFGCPEPAEDTIKHYLQLLSALAPCAQFSRQKGFIH